MTPATTPGDGRPDWASPPIAHDRWPGSSRPPVVLVVHGSPDPRSRAVVRGIATAADATATFLDFDAPHPVAVLERLADLGHRRATVVPLLLTHAYHGRVDVPRIAAEAASARPRLSIDVTDPVGGDHLIPALTRSLTDTVGALARRRGGSGEPTEPPVADAVVLASAGTRDTDTLDRLRALATELGHATGIPAGVGYASAATPTVAEAVTRLRRRGSRRVAVASYFIAPGVLHDRVVTAAMEVGAVVTPPLGACPELVAAITDRRSPPVDSLPALAR